jgi:hypothetical protein
VRMRRGGISSFAFYFARPLVCLCNIYISGVLRRCVGGAAWRGVAWRGVAWRNKRRQKKLVASISPSNPSRDEKYRKTCVLGR